jgi:hypothetical protein
LPGIGAAHLGDAEARPEKLFFLFSPLKAASQGDLKRRLFPHKKKGVRERDRAKFLAKGECTYV